MDVRKYFQEYLLLIFLISIHHGYCWSDDDYEDLPGASRCPRIRSKLKNGRVRLRYKGRVAKFLCDSGYELAGKRSSTCVRGQWNNPPPVCVARGCNRVPSIPNGRVTEMYRGALLVYDCNPGYTLNGDLSIHCDGRQWNTSPPICSVNPDFRPETKCDFESPTLCGWSHDPTHDFDWFRNQFDTPSGHVGTGPSHDHTFGENKAGYYMYIEASSPRKTNDTARLFSPVYPSKESGGCFTFWYHMYGATTGGLRVYFKPESHVFGELSPKWEKFGDQGNQWLRGNISVPAVTENFQIVIEGIRGESYVGDSAIDDVYLSTLDCQAMENDNDTTSEATASNSCRGRCRAKNLPEDSCECSESCVSASTCCSDYHILCSGGNDSIEQNTNEPEPGDYYGKTTSPVTVAATLSKETTTEVQNSTTNSNISSQFTSQSSTTSITSSVPVSSSTIRVTPEASSSSLSTPSTLPTSLTTDATKSSTTATIVKTEPQTLADISTSRRTSTVIPVMETSTPKPSTTVRTTTTTLSTTPEVVTSASTNPVKPTSTTKTSPTSTRSTLTTTSLTTPFTTTTTTTQRSTTTTPMTTTQSSTTTQISTTPQSTTTTTPMSTTQSSTMSTPMSPTTTSSYISITPTTMRSTTLKPVPVTFTQSTLLSTLASRAIFTSSVSQSYTTSTSTPRYNLRPRKTTSISTSTGTTQSSSTRISTSTTASTFKTESSTVSSAMSPKRTRWQFDFKISSTSTLGSILTTPSYRIPIYTQKTSKYPNSEPKSTTPLIPISTSDSYEMIAAKTESSKSSGSSSTVIGVGIFLTICIAGIAVFYTRRYMRKRWSKMRDDSEMRFLPENDYMEYSDASSLERILAK